MARTSLRLPAAACLLGIVALAAAYAADAAKSAPAGAVAAPAAAAASATGENGPKAWTMDDLALAVADLGKGRNFEQGRRMFADMMCGGCHAFSTYSQGGGLAPDLTPLGSKMTREAILSSILEPSYEINGQYYATKLTLKNGQTLEGALIESGEEKYVLVPALLAPELTIEVKAADVAEQEISKLSQMPAGLLNSYTRDQILDFMAFLVSSGQSDAAVFQK